MTFSLLLQLAQAVPSTDDLKTGDSQVILAWIVGLLLVAIVGLIGWHQYRESVWEKRQTEWSTKNDKQHGRMMKLALRVQKALEVWAGIPASTLVDEEDEET